jgi:CelD/BcsL family acetyltransferase involved in cellulose biosynthesis
LRKQSNNLHVEDVQNIDQMYALEREWTALGQAGAPDFTYFQTYAWCISWWENVGQYLDQATPHILCARRDEVLVAVWPLMSIREKFGVKTLVPLGYPHVEYSNILADTNNFSVEDTDALIDASSQIASQDLLGLAKVPEPSVLARVSNKLGHVTPVDEVASIFDLSEIDSFEQTQSGLSKNSRKRRKQRRKKLDQTGNVKFRVYWGAQPEYSEMVSQAFRMKREWLNLTGRNDSKFLVPGYEEFISALPGEGDARKGAVAGVLSVDGNPVAIEIGFVQLGHYYAYIGAFDWGKRDLSVGKIQMEETLNWAIETGLEKYDLLAEPANYKDSWSNMQVPLASYVQARSIKGYAWGVFWQLSLRPRFKLLFNRMPISARTRVLKALQSVKQLISRAE